MKTGIAYPAFFEIFQEYFPELEVVKIGEKYDLIIFSGGEDISPKYYGEPNTFSFPNPRRDEIEVEVFNYYKYQNVFFFGVCRGHQLLNILLGTVPRLIQDIAYELGEGHESYHPLNYKIKTDKLPDRVNSIHHQGVPESFATIATWNGVAEITGGDSWLSVQYHPEFMGDMKTINLVKKLVEIRPINVLSYLEES